VPTIYIQRRASVTLREETNPLVGYVYAMPAFPKRRLDIYIVAGHDAATARAAVSELWCRGIAEEVFDAGGLAASGASAWLPGGFATAVVDSPTRMRWYHSGLGGLGVRCPNTQASVVAQFVDQITSWREGGPWAFRCEPCGQQHELPDLDYAPTAAFGYSALVLRDIQSAFLSPYAESFIADHASGFSIVLHRPG
jgi:hypothetical protein